MAQSPLKLSGKLGDLIYFEGKNKTFVKKAPTDHNLSLNSKLQTTEFAQASTIASLIRHACEPLLTRKIWIESFNKLNSVVFKIINAHDAPRGKKKFMQGNLNLLLDFNFYFKKKMRNLLRIIPVVTLDLDKETLRIQIPAFKPTDAVSWPAPNKKAAGMVMQFVCAVCTPKDKSWDTFLTPPLTCQKKNSFPVPASPSPSAHSTTSLWWWC